MSINANSIQSTNKRNELEALVSLSDISIIIIGETKLAPKMESTHLQIPGFVLAARADRFPDTCGGGTCIYVKTDVLYNNVVEKSINLQTQICSIKVKDVYIIGIYRQPHCNKTADQQALSFLKDEFNGKQIILTGDLNLRGFNWYDDIIMIDSEDGSGLSKEAQRNVRWKEYMLEMSYEQHIDEPTHNLGNQLDVVITNKGCDILRRKPYVDNVTFQGFSDHCGIIIDANIIVDNHTAMKTIFDFKKMDWSLLNEQIMSKNLEENIYNNDIPNEKWIYFRNSLLEARFEICPLKKIGFSQKSPWVTPNLQKLLRKDRRLRRAACKYRPTSDKKKRASKKWSKFHQNIIQRVKLARINYETKVIKSLKFNRNSIHEHFKKLSGSSSIPPIEDSNGELITNEVERCNAFQDQFISVFGKRKPKIGYDWANDGKLSDINLTYEKLSKVIGKMRLNSAPGLDAIGSNMYKKCLQVIAWPLLDIFRSVLDTSSLPVDWTISKVSPLYKGSGSKSDLKRWRPLSLGCTGLRIFERLIDIDFRKIVEESGILPIYQHGFRPRYSTITNLASSWNYLVSCVDKQDSRNVLGLDGTCAFDVLKIPYILSQMEKIGIYGKVARFLEAWLIQRFQYVQLNGSCSYIAKVFSGVPQGSVLGPLIFILASGSGLSDIEIEINELARSMSTPEIKFYVYADDIKTIFSLKNETEKEVVTKLLQRLENYSDLTGLRFNANKSQLLRLGPSQLQTDLSLCGSIIPEVKYLKDLGCVFSKTYTFVSMMNIQLAKARRTIRMVSNKLLVRNAESLKLIYQAYFQSSLLYSSEIWLNLESSTLGKLVRIDESFWKLLPENEVKPKCYNSVQVAIKKNLMLYFKHHFKICKTDLTINFSKFGNTQTRESLRGDLKPPKSRLSVGTREFVTVTTKLYNQMNHEKRTSKLLINFEKEVNRMVEELYNDAKCASYA